MIEPQILSVFVPSFSGQVICVACHHALLYFTGIISYSGSVKKGYGGERTLVALTLA